MGKPAFRFARLCEDIKANCRRYQSTGFCLFRKKSSAAVQDRAKRLVLLGKTKFVIFCWNRLDNVDNGT